MKRTRVQRFIGVDARDAAELAELLNEKVEQLKGEQPQIKWFDGQYSALLMYTEHIEIPENIRACVPFYRMLEEGEIFK